LVNEISLSVGSWVRETDSQNLKAPSASRSSYLGTNLDSFRNSKSSTNRIRDWSYIVSCFKSGLFSYIWNSYRL